jgi:hypothetical protein
MIRGAICRVVVEFVFQVIRPLVGEEATQNMGPTDVFLGMDEFMNGWAGVDIFQGWPVVKEVFYRDDDSDMKIFRGFSSLAVL